MSMSLQFERFGLLLPSPTEPCLLNYSLFFSSGTLDCHELRMLLRSLGVNEKEISMLIASVDNDRDGDLTFEEFASAVGSTEATSRA